MTTTAPLTNSTRTLTRAAAALVAALVPVLAGLALLCSERARRKAIALFGGDHIASAPAAQIGKTWGIGLLMIGALQALGSLALGLSITEPYCYCAPCLRSPPKRSCSSSRPAQPPTPLQAD